MKKVLPLVVLVPFAAWSSLVIFEHGYFGFVTLALREPWAMQLLVDLSISLVLVGTWLVRDARKHGISPIPYLVLMLFAGSMGALVYLVRRNLKGERAAALA